MRSFGCENCGNLEFFENTACLRCGLAQGFLPHAVRLAAIIATVGDEVRLSGGPDGLRRCANAELIGCNWLVEDDVSSGGSFCRSCRLTRTRPADGDVAGMTAWVKAEAAKRRLVFQLDEMRIPVRARSGGFRDGLAFDLLSSRDAPVTTGHEDGVVTIDMAEGLDSHRERVREQLAEPYRTLLGHFRHETGHYYEWLLVELPGRQDDLRPLFGDERKDYAAELDRHYKEGPPADWAESYVSAYATMHPYEDFAETFAHYLHIRDALQTASHAGIWVAGPDVPADPLAPLSALPTDGAGSTMPDLLAAWVPLTLALNAVNRSMGHNDLYPFAIAPTVASKLEAVHNLLATPDIA